MTGPVPESARDEQSGPEGRPKIVYFGTLRVAGHRFMTPDGHGIRYSMPTEVVPWGYKIDGGFTPQSTSKHGAALLTHTDGWTVLSIHDYTVDTRHGSHSTFAIEAEINFDAALALAAEVYPWVTSRVGAIEQVTS